MVETRIPTNWEVTVRDTTDEPKDGVVKTDVEQAYTPKDR